jgi:hypothetical protein
MATHRTTLVLIAATVAALAACSSSTSPSKSSTGTSGVNPGNAAQGDSINLSGTYDLVSFTYDSSDGNSSSETVDANDGGTLVLTATTLDITWTGSFLANNGSDVTGSYVAVDTSSTADRGVLHINSTQTQTGTYSLSNNTFTVSLPEGGNGVTDVSVWAKQ